MFGVNKAYKSLGIFGVLFLAPKKLVNPLGVFKLHLYKICDSFNGYKRNHQFN
jgi:hypothetical protein